MGYPETSAGNYHLNPEDGTVRLSRNVGKKFPLEPRRWDLWLFRNVDKKFPLQPRRWDRLVVSKRRQEISTWTPKVGPTVCPETSTRNFHLTPQVGLIGCPETSLRNYHYSKRNNTEERSSVLVYLSAHVSSYISRNVYISLFLTKGSATSVSCEILRLQMGVNTNWICDTYKRRRKINKQH